MQIFRFCQADINEYENKENNVKKYLEKYSYLNTSSAGSLTSIYEASINFQESYKVPVDVKENAESLKLFSDSFETF